MPRAFCLIRPQPVYRSDAFRQGLKAAGYEVRGAPGSVEPGDVVCMWNRYTENHELACRVEKAGATVIVAENAYVLSRFDGGEHYAISKHAHNGRGEWPTGGPERWESFGIPLKPWRTSGEHVLIAPNRGFGQPGGIMHPSWARGVKERLKRYTKREIRIREHPGNVAPKVPLERDLENAWAVIVWSSSAGVRALIEGVPVFYEAPYWICSGAASKQIENIESPFMDSASRLDSFRSLSYAQWSVAEINSGEPFRRLLQC